MPPDFIQQLQHRLIALGCPTAQLRRLTQEMAEHREDIWQAALAEGLSGAVAEAWVDARLGDPQDLAEHQMMMLRQSSWMGRHYIVSFCVFPLVLVPVLWVLLMGLNLSLEFALGFGWDQKRLHVAGDNPATYHHMVLAVNGDDIIAVSLMTLIVCWLGRRSAVGLTWMLTACGICSLYALFIWVQLNPHSFAVGISSSPHWFKAAIPLLIASAIYILRQRKVRTFREQASA